ncbi:Chemotaxis protein CheV [hydrothermal vent metagenome]|uniref:Chemotaxis protein CheV n=1 Tax=hydrothermal vent metagenome TaxID=652676 RepID=A0A3B0YYI4_9ZZZZ
MSNILDGVDQRTQLAGHNRLELLLFRLVAKQCYGINVFKVREVIQCPSLSHIPHSNPVIRGVVTIRGSTIPVMDLSMAVGLTPVNSIENTFIVITEYNRSIQGFLVNSVERIINLAWSDIETPPRIAGTESYLTAVCKVDEELIEIIDVEKVLSEVVGMPVEVSDELREEVKECTKKQWHILISDDSSVARHQVQTTVAQLGFEVTLAADGKEALGILKQWKKEESEILDRLLMVISDVEMPVMDGYAFTSAVRKLDGLSETYIILHTSLSGVFNQTLIEKVGADLFIPKFHADELGQAVLGQLKKREAKEVVENEMA